MVRLKGQLLSSEAGGSLGKTLTFSSWKGRAYAKQYKVPTDPNSPAQLGLREAMAFLSTQWSTLSEANRQTWSDLATSREITLLDAYISVNLQRFTVNKGLTQEYPAAVSIAPPDTTFQSAVATGRFVTLTGAVAPPTAPWALIFYASQSTGFTPGPHNMVGAVASPAFLTNYSIRTTPPSLGYWYFRMAHTTVDGTLKLNAIQKDVIF